MIARKKNFVLCCNNFLVTRLATWEGVRVLSMVCGSQLALGMIWRLQWSGTCNDIVNTLQPTCHQLSSTNGSPVKCVISQSEVRRQKPAVTCEEESFQGCDAATNPTLHIFLLTFGHFMPFYVLGPRYEHVATACELEIQHSVHQGDWFVTPHPVQYRPALISTLIPPSQNMHISFEF